MKKRFFIATALIAFSMVMAGFATGTQAAQSTGNSSLQLSGNFRHAQDTDTGTLNLDVGYGYFLTDNWEAGVAQTLDYTFINHQEDIWIASTIPYINYNFRGLSANDAIQPFIGAFTGASYTKDDTQGTIGPQLGVKAFVNTSTFILVKYRYEWFFEKLTINSIDDTRSDGSHVVTMGVGFVF